MKAQWIVLIVVGAVLLAGALVFLLMRKGPDLSAYLPLRQPRIVTKPKERVLEVAFSGPADTVIKKAYSVLFKAYFGLKGSPRGPSMKVPKARYELPAANDPGAGKKLGEFLAHDWKGSVAIPIPEELDVPDREPDANGMAARAASWEYGETAEILHLGSYETEQPTIEKLYAFIAQKGYRMIGDHEEEYLKGPGMMLVAPKDYWTIIRCRVAKAR